MAKDSSADRYWLVGGKKPVPTMTLPAGRFAADHSRLLNFVVFWLRAKLFFAPLHAREVAKITETEIEEQRVEPTNESVRIFWPSPRTPFDYEAHESLVQEMIVTRLVDNFLSYLSDLLALIYKTQPAMLKSSEQETLEFILQFDSMDTLRSALAEKRVERLAYLGLRDLQEYLEKQTNFSLLPDKSTLEKAALLVEIRNVIVHNRAIVGNPTVRRFPSLKNALGKRLYFKSDELEDYKDFIGNVVIDIDVRATVKFKLPAQPTPELSGPIDDPSI